jgi:hypothetical protein
MAHLTMGNKLLWRVIIGNMKKADAIRTIQRAEGNFGHNYFFRCLFWKN